MFFTNLGKVHWTRVYDIPQKKRSAKGRALVNFLSLGENERVTTTVAIDDFDATRSFLMVTRKGVVKKTLLSAYSRPQKGGIIGINLKKEDKLIKALLVEEGQDVVLSTKQGKAIHFSEKDIRPTGRASIGVKGISLNEEDEIRDAVIAEKNLSLLTITSERDPERICLEICKTIAKLMHADVCLIALPPDIQGNVMIKCGFDQAQAVQKGLSNSVGGLG